MDENGNFVRGVAVPSKWRIMSWFRTLGAQGHWRGHLTQHNGSKRRRKMKRRQRSINWLGHPTNKKKKTKEEELQREQVASLLFIRQPPTVEHDLTTSGQSSWRGSSPDQGSPQLQCATWCPKLPSFHRDQLQPDDERCPHPAMFELAFPLHINYLISL